MPARAAFLTPTLWLSMCRLTMESRASGTRSGSCPRCGVLTQEEVEVGDKGTVTTFCVVRVPSENIELKLPYTAAYILLDGADIPFFAILQECEAEDVRMGMRVEAVWAPREERGPTVANIRYFRPIDEPDVPFEEFEEHL